MKIKYSSGSSVRLSPTGQTQIRDAFVLIGHAQRNAPGRKTSRFQQRTQKSEGRARPASMAMRLLSPSTPPPLFPSPGPKVPASISASSSSNSSVCLRRARGVCNGWRGRGGRVRPGRRTLRGGGASSGSGGTATLGGRPALPPLSLRRIQRALSPLYLKLRATSRSNEQAARSTSRRPNPCRSSALASLPAELRPPHALPASSLLCTASLPRDPLLFPAPRRREPAAAPRRAASPPPARARAPAPPPARGRDESERGAAPVVCVARGGRRNFASPLSSNANCVLRIGHRLEADSGTQNTVWDANMRLGRGVGDSLRLSGSWPRPRAPAGGRK